MNLGFPVLPPLRVRRTKSANYLYTYDHKWIPATKGPDGEVIKKGHTDISNKKIVGKLVEGDKASFAVFYDEFLEQYPELRYFTAFRNKNHSWVFKKTSELDQERPDDKAVIDLLVEKHNYTVDEAGRVLKPAEEIEKRATTADILSSKTFEDGRTILEKRPERSRKHSKEIISTVDAGSMALLEEIARSTGLTAALQKTVKKICSKSSTKYSAQQINEIVCTLECFVIYIAMTGQSTYEGYEEFVSTHAVKEAAASCRATVKEYTHLIDHSFVDTFHKNFIQIYLRLRGDQVSKRCLSVCTDGTTAEPSNTELLLGSAELNKEPPNKHQIKLLTVVDSAPDGLPLFFDILARGPSDSTTDKHVLDKAGHYGLSFEDQIVVCNSGNGNSDSLEHPLGKETKFLMNCRQAQGAIVTNMIDEAIQNGILVNTTWARRKMISLTGGRVNYWSKKVTYTYDHDPVEWKRASKKAHADVTFHVFFDKDIFNRECESLDNRLASALQKVDEGEPLTTTEIALLKKCSNFDEKEYVPGSPLKTKLEVNIAIYNELSKYFGLQVLLTNDNELTSEDVMELYSNCSNVDTTININMQGPDEPKTQVNSDDCLISQLMLQHLATILKCSLAHRTAYARNADLRMFHDVFSSTKDVLTLFSTVRAEKYETGYVLSPIGAKQLHAFEYLGVPLPKKVRTLSKSQESLSSDDDCLLEYEEL